MLTGRLVHQDTTRGILNVRGVGYEIFSPARVLERWNQEEEVTAWISTRVREDAITLYAFGDEQERRAFEVLISVSGVGPKMGLAALDTLTLVQLVEAIETDNITGLCKISGVGKKTAQRLALELKGKLPLTFVPSKAAKGKVKPTPQDNLPLALAQLDYGKSEIDRALRGLEAQDIPTDAPLQERVAAALRILSGS